MATTEHRNWKERKRLNKEKEKKQIKQKIAVQAGSKTKKEGKSEKGRKLKGRTEAAVKQSKSRVKREEIYLIIGIKCVPAVMQMSWQDSNKSVFTEKQVAAIM